MLNKIALFLSGAAVCAVALALWTSGKTVDMLAAKIESLKANDTTEVQPDGVH